MQYYSQKELDDALSVLSTTIAKCENMKLKFQKGSSQHTLLVNRINALNISKDLIEGINMSGKYSLSDMEKALPPIVSIIQKTEKARGKYEVGTVQYRRFSLIIDAMYIAKDFIEKKITEII